VNGGVALGLARQRAVLDQPGGAAYGNVAQKLVDLEPEQRDEGLVTGVGQVRAPALAARPECAILVDADDGTDFDPFAAFEAGQSPVQVGWTGPCSVSNDPASGLSGAYSR
jgi:hypothetical protein